jgi:hypothetical protein
MHSPVTFPLPSRIAVWKFISAALSATSGDSLAHSVRVKTTGILLERPRQKRRYTAFCLFLAPVVAVGVAPVHASKRLWPHSPQTSGFSL